MSVLQFLKRSVNLKQPTMKLLGARHKVYHRTNREHKKSIRDYDDGYYYRNGEEQYAQTLRNRQAEMLRFDDIYYKLSRNRRKFNQTHIDFPNCTCAEDVKEYEKIKGKQPLPETASPVKDIYRLYSMWKYKSNDCRVGLEMVYIAVERALQHISLVRAKFLLNNSVRLYWIKNRKSLYANSLLIFKSTFLIKLI